MSRKVHQPLPTSLQSDFIPSEIMDALAPRHPPPPGPLDPPERQRRLPGRAASVWNFPHRRERLKHLTHNAACVCGAGKNLSFLYDVLTEPDAAEEPKATLQPSTRLALAKRGVNVSPEATPEVKLPDTLVASEFHIVKNKGVEDLEYRDEPFTTLPLAHETHPVGFPSMQPSSKLELKQLRRTVDSLLEELGVRRELSLSGPTQMHRLLELVKKEQDVYNVLFFEIIRQATVECTERGGLLAKLRQNYKEMLERAPVQVKGLHDEVMAQRAMDRRLTEELLRFKRAIGGLTSELSDVKKHDQQSFSEAQFTREELKGALEKAQRSSNLLEEYHSLYELQRERLNEQVSRLAEERQMWRRAAYDLSLRVTQQSRLATVKALQRSETEWYRLANFFTEMLTARDHCSSADMKENVKQWRSRAEDMALLLASRDQQTARVIVEVRDKIETLRYAFVEAFFHQKRPPGLSACSVSTGIVRRPFGSRPSGPMSSQSSKDGHMIRSPDSSKAAEILSSIVEWEQALSNEIENFGGDAMLTMQDNMTFMKRLVHNWTDVGLALFMRHKQEENGESYPEHGTMLRINKEIDDLMAQFMVRLTGENGVARTLITLNNILESWHIRIDSVFHSSKSMPDAEWSRFYTLLDDWIAVLDESEHCVGRTQREEDYQADRIHKHLEVSQVILDVNKWMESSANGIESEDMRLNERVLGTHTSMIRWMVQMLLRLAPDFPGNSLEAHESALLASASPEDLNEMAAVLSAQLSSFTKYLAQCCHLIVADIMQKKLDNHQDDAEFEFNLLKELQAQADIWVSLSGNLLGELESGEVAIERDTPEEEPEVQVKDADQIREESLANLEVRESVLPPKTPDMEHLISREPSVASSGSGKDPRLQSIGFDKNTHVRELSQDPNEAQQDVVSLEPGLQPSVLNTARAFSTMQTVEELQLAVSKEEETAQDVEGRCMTVELELAETKERCDSLSARLELLQHELKTLAPPPEPAEKPEMEVLTEQDEEAPEEGKKAP